MNRIKMLLFNLLLHGMIDNIENERKTILLNLMLYLGAIFSAVFSVIEIFSSEYMHSVYTFAVGAVCVFLIILFRLKKNEKLISILVVLFMFVMITATGISGRLPHVSKVALYIFPLAAFFLTGAKWGFLVTGIILAYFSVILFISPDGPITDYSHSYLIKIMTTYFVIGVFGFIFEFTRENTQRKMEKKNLQLMQLVNDQKNSESKIKDANKKLQQFYDLIPSAVYTVDKNRIITSANRKAQDILGYKEDELIGRHCSVFALEPCLSKCTLYSDAIDKPAVGRICSVKTKDGATRVIRKNSDLITDESGENVTGGVESFDDITEIQRINDEISKLSAAVTQSSSCIVITDVNGIIEYVNPKMEQISGYGAEELVGQYVRNLGGGEINRNSIWATVRSGKEWHGEFYNTRKNGEKYWVYSSVAPIKNKDGITTHYISIQDDISERKAMEDELIRARDKAESAAKAKSEFLANMSHEIRTPMNGIIGMTELALETDLTDEQKEYLQMVKVSATSLLDIINSILDFSKIEAGKYELENTEFNLLDELSSTISSLKVMAGKKKIKLITDIDGNIPERLTGDSGKMRQVVTNILGNAVKFTQAGEVYFKILTEEESESDISLRFIVEDTGIGIPSDKISMIFSPFTQADSSVSRKFGGTGLGTTISKRFVEMMGGNIFVSSPSSLSDSDGRGPGTAFSFNLVFKKNSPGKKQSGDIPKRSGETKMPEGDRPILVAEDNAVNQKVAVTILEKAGFKADAVSNGAEALEALRKKEYFLIFMDVQMPEMDGIEATGRIRADEAKRADGEKESPEGFRYKAKRIPIVALTANAVKGDMEEYIKKGMDGYLAKPFTRESLLNAVNVHLEY